MFEKIKKKNIYCPSGIMDIHGLINGILSFEGNIYYFLITFAILGGGIKYVDDAFDEESFKKRNAMIVAPVLGILWGYTCLINQFAGTLLLAILLSVLLTGKIDNLGHQLGLAIIIALLILAGLNVVWVPLIFLVIGGIIDETGNDLMDEKAESFTFNGAIKNFLIYFFKYRFMMKIIVVILTVVGMIPLYLFGAFILFEVWYIFVTFLSEKLKTNPSNASLWRSLESLDFSKEE